MTAFSSTEQDVLNRIMRKRKRFKSLANADILSPQSASQVDAVLGGTMPGYAATSPTAQAVAYEAAARGEKLYQRPRFQPSAANVAKANQQLQYASRAGETEEQWYQRVGGTVVGQQAILSGQAKFTQVTPRSARKAATKTAATPQVSPTNNIPHAAGGPTLPLEAYGNGAYTHAADPRSLAGTAGLTATSVGGVRTAGASPSRQYANALSTPVPVEFSSVEMAGMTNGRMPFITAPGTSDSIEVGQIVQSNDGMFYRNDAQAGMMTPVVFDPGKADWVTRDTMLDKMAQKDMRVSNEFNKLRNARIAIMSDDSLDDERRGQALGQVEQRLNALAQAVMAGGPMEQSSGIAQQIQEQIWKDEQGNVWTMDQNGVPQVAKESGADNREFFKFYNDVTKALTPPKDPNDMSGAAPAPPKPAAVLAHMKQIMEAKVQFDNMMAEQQNGEGESGGDDEELLTEIAMEHPDWSQEQAMAELQKRKGATQ